jgi:hypothetical protein
MVYQAGSPATALKENLMINRGAKRMRTHLQQNQRQFPRRAAFIIAKYTVKEGTFRDIIKNIGATGIYIGTWRRVSQGQPIELSFPVFDFDNQFQVTGMVVRSDRKGFSVVFDEPIEGLICKEGHFPEIVHESER